MSMTSVAWPLISAEPSTPGCWLTSSMSSFCSTMSTISSTTRAMERPSSEKTSSGCLPVLLMRTSSLTGISGISWPRYCTSERPFGGLDLADVDLLEAGHQRQQHRARLRRAGAEHQHRLDAGIVVLPVGLLPGRGGIALDDHVSDRLGDAVRLDDHDHRAVAQDRIAGEQGDMAKLARHRLHHDLLGVEHRVDHDAERLAADLGDHDEAVLGLAIGAGVDLEQNLEVNERKQLVAQAQDRRILDVLDAMLGIAAHAHQLDDGELGNGEAIAGRFHDQGGNDRERERES